MAASFKTSNKPIGFRIFRILYAIGFVLVTIMLIPLLNIFVPQFSIPGPEGMHFLLLYIQFALTITHPLSSIMGNSILLQTMLGVFTVFINGIMVYALQGRTPQKRKRVIVIAIIGAIVAGISFFNFIGLIINIAVVYYMILPHVRDYYE